MPEHKPGPIDTEVQEAWADCGRGCLGTMTTLARHLDTLKSEHEDDCMALDNRLATVERDVDALKKRPSCGCSECF